MPPLFELPRVIQFSTLTILQSLDFDFSFQAQRRAHQASLAGQNELSTIAFKPKDGIGENYFRFS
jgi:hypothetical protein